MRKYVKHSTCLYYEEHYVWFDRYVLYENPTQDPDPAVQRIFWEDDLYDRLLDEAAADDYSWYRNEADDETYAWFFDEDGNRVKKFDPRWTWKKIGLFDCVPV